MNTVFTVYEEAHCRKALTALAKVKQLGSEHLKQPFDILQQVYSV